MALLLNCTGNLATDPYISTENVTLDFPLTIAAWIRVDDFSAGAFLMNFAKRSAAESDAYFTLQGPNSRFRSVYGKGSGLSYNIREGISDKVAGTWYHVIWEFEKLGETTVLQEIYVDCVSEDDGGTSSEQWLSDADIFTIARLIRFETPATSSVPFAIELLGIWNRLLTNGEKNQLCNPNRNAPPSSVPSGLTNYWPLKSNSQDQVGVGDFTEFNFGGGGGTFDGGSVIQIDDEKTNNQAAYVNYGGTGGTENKDWAKHPFHRPGNPEGPSIDEANNLFGSRFSNPRHYKGDSDS